MNNDNHKNLSCGFNEQLVSHLYGEASETEKFVLEAHLRNCINCADEFASFSLVRSSIGEWRKESFSSLVTPAFEMLFEKNETIAKDTVSHSLLEQVRAYFSLSPAWTTGAATFAALAVCVGLYWIAANSSSENTIAVIEKPAVVKTVSSPPVNTDNKSSVDSSLESINTPDTPPIPIVSKQPKGTSPRDAVAPVKIDHKQPVKAKKSAATMVERNNEKSTSKSTNRENVPSLVVQDDEDDSLRLSDIFEEVSMR